MRRHVKQVSKKNVSQDGGDRQRLRSSGTVLPQCAGMGVSYSRKATGRPTAVHRNLCLLLVVGCCLLFVAVVIHKNVVAAGRHKTVHIERESGPADRADGVWTRHVTACRGVV